MPRLQGIHDVDLVGKRVLIRVDYNVPLTDGSVGDDTRVLATLPTLQMILEAGASIILMSHLGRPREGAFDETLSLLPVTNCLSALLNKEVRLIRNWIDGVDIDQGGVVLLENVRFEEGELENDDELARKMAALCDVFVNDAFATAHRAQASTHGVAKFAPISCAGPLMMAEIEALGLAFENPARPMTAIVGGSKVSTKLTVLESLMDKIDQLIIGGGIANTFLKARGYNIGNSLYEAELVSSASVLLDLAEKQGKQIPLPVDVVCARTFSKDADACIKKVSEVVGDDLILDVGPETADLYASIIRQAKTIVWNGPLGVFEFDQFGHGTAVLAKAIAQSGAFSVAGGGDTLSAIAKFRVASGISYISTGGGAFLEFLEGKQLPAVAVLETSRNQAHASN
jgi:phosphoglycerate kinase